MNQRFSVIKDQRGKLVVKKRQSYLAGVKVQIKFSLWHLLQGLSPLHPCFADWQLWQAWWRSQSMSKEVRGTRILTIHVHFCFDKETEAEPESLLCLERFSLPDGSKEEAARLFVYDGSCWEFGPEPQLLLTCSGMAAKLSLYDGFCWGFQPAPQSLPTCSDMTVMLTVWWILLRNPVRCKIATVDLSLNWCKQAAP